MEMAGFIQIFCVSYKDLNINEEIIQNKLEKTTDHGDAELGCRQTIPMNSLLLTPGGCFFMHHRNRKRIE